MKTITNPNDFIAQFPRYVYRSGKGKSTVQWREAALDMANDRAKLVEALRNALRSDKFKAIAETEARALLREIGE